MTKAGKSDVRLSDSMKRGANFLEPTLVSALQNFITAAPVFPEAKCKDIADPDLFFPTSNEEYQATYQQVQSICGSCVHQIECALYAVNYEVPYGIWGGTNREQRLNFWKERKFNFVARKGRNCRDMLRQGMNREEIAKRHRTTPEKVDEFIKVFEETEANEKDVRDMLAFRYGKGS